MNPFRDEQFYAHVDLNSCFAILVAASPSATEAFHHPRNASRLINRQSETELGSAPGATPEVRTEPARLVLSLAPEQASHNRRDFCFGSLAESEEIDVVLAREPSRSGVSRYHFRLTPLEDGIILRNHSRNGTKIEDLHSGSWELKGQNCMTICRDAIIQAGFVRLHLKIPARTMKQVARFSANYDAFMQHATNAEPVVPSSEFLATIGDPQKLELGPPIVGNDVSTIFRAYDVKNIVYCVKVYRPAHRKIWEREKSLLSTLSHVRHFR